MWAFHEADTAGVVSVGGVGGPGRPGVDRVGLAVRAGLGDGPRWRRKMPRSIKALLHRRQENNEDLTPNKCRIEVSSNKLGT